MGLKILVPANFWRFEGGPLFKDSQVREVISFWICSYSFFLVFQSIGVGILTFCPPFSTMGLINGSGVPDRRPASAQAGAFQACFFVFPIAQQFFFYDIKGFIGLISLIRRIGSFLPCHSVQPGLGGQHLYRS